MLGCGRGRSFLWGRRERARGRRKGPRARTSVAFLGERGCEEEAETLVKSERKGRQLCARGSAACYKRDASLVERNRAVTREQARPVACGARMGAN